MEISLRTIFISLLKVKNNVLASYDKHIGCTCQILGTSNIR